jgi:carbonic anhydrase/acetyltransferase-like protein (isoleucine patch superfamily)
MRHDLRAIDPIVTGVAGIAERLQRGPRQHPSVFLAPSATVVGDVTLEEESSVWYGAVLRGDINRIVVGPRSNIQDNAVLHLADDFPVLIGELVTIGHSAIVHACTIDDESLIGMGGIILDGAEIGARSIIGANTLVTLGMKVPAGSLVLGSPGKVVRQLTLEEQTTTSRWARKYVETAKRFREFSASGKSTIDYSLGQ